MKNGTYKYTIHDHAMDFADEADQALKKGDVHRAQMLFEKAFEMEKTYLLEIPKDDPVFHLTRSIIYRSAAWLALQSGHYKEAEQLAQQILNEKPHTSIVHEIEEVLIEAQKEIRKKEKAQTDITGILVSADILSEWIKIQDDRNKLYLVMASKKRIKQIVKSFLGEKVSINGKWLAQGSFRLEDIRKAA